jgi:pimeloyl-ACP methyl ester carboxylesterase
LPDRIAQARARVDVILEAERRCEAIDPQSRTRAWIGDSVTARSVVLLHGITNGPLQYALLGEQLAARGHNVIVPRVRFHGYRDRMTDAIANLRAADFESAALDGVAIGALCGERVVTLGISVGAVVAGWLAARVAIDTAIAIAPFCGVREVPGRANDLLGSSLRTMPNVFSWWDPRRKTAQPPPHGYPRFPTRGLGEALGISTELAHTTSGAYARRVFLVLNRYEPIVNNPFARRRFAELQPLGVEVDDIELDGLPHIHDIIEPQIPEARPDLVYPRLIELIERT